MGRPMAANLVKAGHEVTVWNRTPGKAPEVTAMGAREADSVADATQGAALVITSLANDDAVRGQHSDLQTTVKDVVIDGEPLKGTVALSGFGSSAILRATSVTV